MPTEHTVEQGETFASIGHDHGFPDWHVLLHVPENRELTQTRTSPFILYPGDVVTVPDKNGSKWVSKPTEQRHTFIRKSTRIKLRLELRDQRGELLTNFHYRLEFSGQVREGTSDGDGIVEEMIPANTQEASLRLPNTRNGTQFERTLQLRVGHLDPIDTVSGAHARLGNLGYAAGEPDVEWSEHATEALRAFQAANDLEVTGEYDDATRAKLREVHKC
jgi:hypothetical protein